MIPAHEDAEKIINQLRANKVVRYLVEWSESDCKNYIVVKLNEENKEKTYLRYRIMQLKVVARYHL
jgi:hypothetical protein